MMLLFARLISIISGLIGIFVIDRFMNKNDIANYYFTFGVFGLLTQVLVGPYGQYVYANSKIFTIKQGNENNFELFNAYLLSASCVGGLLYLFYIVMHGNLSDFESISTFALLLCYIFFGGFVQTLIPLFNIVGDNNFYFRITIVNSATSILISIACYFLFETYTSWIFGLILSQIFSYIILFKHINFNYPSLSFSRGFLHFVSLKHFILPLIYSAILLWINFQFYKLYPRSVMSNNDFATFIFSVSVASSLVSIVEQLIYTFIILPTYGALKVENFFKSRLLWVIFITIGIFISVDAGLFFGLKSVLLYLFNNIDLNIFFSALVIEQLRVLIFFWLIYFNIIKKTKYTAFSISISSFALLIMFSLTKMNFVEMDSLTIVVISEIVLLSTIFALTLKAKYDLLKLAR